MNDNGVVFWRGPSPLDGAPIVAILTGIKRPSKNPKTGNQLQTWILREDIHPAEAKQSGADFSICGDCAHRGTSCYVNIMGPTSIWRSYRAGNYREYTSLSSFIKKTLKWRSLRIGAYGDPALLPFKVWENLLQQKAKEIGYQGGKSWTGYTHQWRTCDQRYRHILMASVDTRQEAMEAHGLGWRTFRVDHQEHGVLGPIPEQRCPASDEMGNKITCEACTLCQGTSHPSNNKSVVIVAHGTNKRKFQELVV